MAQYVCIDHGWDGTTPCPHCVTEFHTGEPDSGYTNQDPDLKGTMTGRFSAEKSNIEEIPRNTEQDFAMMQHCGARSLGFLQALYGMQYLPEHLRPQVKDILDTYDRANHGF